MSQQPAAEPTELTQPQTNLLDLPQHVLLVVLGQLDVLSLCNAARASPSLMRLAPHRCLWPADGAHADWALEGVRRVLGDILSLPPQVFQAQLDVGRSRRFPVLVPLHNLRTILGTSDAEGLAERTSRALQERVVHAGNNLWRCDSWQQVPPAASISICRADGASIRAALRPQVVVPRLVHQLQRAGWPPQLPDAEIATTEAEDQEGGSGSNGSTDGAVLPPGLLHAVQRCQHHQHLLHNQQIPQLRHLGGYKAAGSRVLPPWRPHMAALQAAAPKLPDEDTARDFAARAIASQQLITSSNDHNLVQRGAAAAVQLFWASIAAGPGQVSLWASERSSWQAPLTTAAKVLARLLALQQQLCHNSSSGGGDRGGGEWQHSNSLEAVWQRVGQAELQLCQGGLSLLVGLPAPHLVVPGLQALDTAVGEYLQASSSSPGDALPGLAHAMSLITCASASRAQQQGTAELRRVMLVEVVRVLEWCLWLLGVDTVDTQWEGSRGDTP